MFPQPTFTETRAHTAAQKMLDFIEDPMRSLSYHEKRVMYEKLFVFFKEYDQERDRIIEELYKQCQDWAACMTRPVIFPDVVTGQR